MAMAAAARRKLHKDHMFDWRDMHRTSVTGDKQHDVYETAKEEQLVY